MKCIICKQGETVCGKTTVTLERESRTIVFKSVPADVCLNCGEAYVSDDLAGRLLEMAEEEISAGVYSEIREYCEPLQV